MVCLKQLIAETNKRIFTALLQFPQTYFRLFSCLPHYGLNTTVYPKKYAHGFCFAVLCCGCTLTDFPISIRLTSLALWQSNDCKASKATLMNMDKYFMWIHYERLHNHNIAKHNKTVFIFLGIYCKWSLDRPCTLSPQRCSAHHTWKELLHRQNRKILMCPPQFIPFIFLFWLVVLSPRRRLYIVRNLDM